MSSFRHAVSRHLVGEGLDLGPGHKPFELPPFGASVRLLDRWEPDANRALFPELGAEAPFPQPDLVVNLDTDRLSAIADDSVDFVIATHILEHLANPLAILDEIHRVVRVGGAALVMLPDRHYTFDAPRKPTSLTHLVDEYERDVTTISDDHFLEFIRVVHHNPDPTTEEIDFHRKRSIHVHCWDADDFTEVITYSISRMGHRWRLHDAIFATALDGDGEEFGYLFQKLPEPADADLLCADFEETLHALAAAKTQMVSMHDEVSRLRAVVDQLLKEREDARREVSEVHASTSWRLTAPLRRVAVAQPRVQGLVAKRAKPRPS